MDNLLVVGASSGVGKECAITLSKEYNVFAVARREDRLNELKEYGITPIVFDLSSLDKIDSFVKSLAKEYDKFKAIVYSAGKQSIKPLRVIKPQDIDDIFHINFYAPMLFAKAFSSRSVHLPNNPSITFISSIAAQKPEKGILTYSASKAALDNLTKGLAKEIAPIRVNAIAPGFMITQMTQAFDSVYTKEFIDKVSKDYPLGLGSVDKVANLVEFLVSQKADYITGDIIRVDGGGIL